MILKVNGLKMSYADRLLFENVSFHIEKGEIVGLLGRNGTGKTTILKILCGKEKADEGTIEFVSKGNIAYLAQLAEYAELSVNDVLMLSFKALNELRKRMDILEEKMADPIYSEQLENLLKEYGEIMSVFENKNGYLMQTKLEMIKENMGIDEKLALTIFDKCSGGEKTKVLLAKALLEEPELLLLDEPTNNLDIDTIEWLEGYVKSYAGSILLVSHDRYFLDKVVDRILELDEDGIEEYSGNYSFYKEEKQKRFFTNLKLYEEHVKKTRRMEMQIRNLRSTGSQLLKGVANQIENRMTKMGKVDKPKVDKNMKMKQLTSQSSGKNLIEVKDLTVTIGKNELLHDVCCAIHKNDRIALVGKNGTGKTTFLKALIEEDNEAIQKATNLTIGYLSQNPIFEYEQRSILDEYMANFPGISEGNARNQLATMLFVGDDVNKKIRVLSGGERVRLKLCILMNKKFNLLILDEPTNHLDLNSREILEENLSNYDGTLLFVSHDRYFLNRMANIIWKIEDKTITTFDCQYNEVEKVKR